MSIHVASIVLLFGAATAGDSAIVHLEAATERGIASWYGPGFHGRCTASGEIYDMYGLSAAHKSLPLGSRVFIENMENGRTMLLRINDRGPFVEGRIIDLSLGAAAHLGVLSRGLAAVEVVAVSEKPPAQKRRDPRCVA